MELLFKKDYIYIFYDPRQIIVIEWVGYFNVLRIKESAKAVIRFLKEKNCKRILMDNRKAKGTLLQSIKWLKREFLPKAALLKGRRTAFVMKDDYLMVRAFERLIEVADKDNERHIFFDYDQAMNWLLGEEATTPSTEAQILDKLTIRVIDKFVVLDYADILYAFSYDKGTSFQCISGTYHVKESLKSVHARLPRNFLQIHRSYIINTDHVAAIKHYRSGSYHLFLQNLPSIKIPVSKKHVPLLKRVLNLE